MDMERYLKWVSPIVLGAGLVASYVTLQNTQEAHAADLIDQSESIDENEEDIQVIQRLLIEQTGNQKLEIQQLRGDVKLILRLLEKIEDQ